MGNRWSPQAALNQAVHRAEDRRGRIPVESRYHRLPKRLEDDYYVGRKVLGSGSNGYVVLATNRHTGNEVAVKRLRLQALAPDKKIELMNEVEVFLCIDHPHVARLFEVYESADALSLVMECMEGGELYDRIAKCRVFQEADAAQATWQMLLAVNYLHSEGIVHRDLKLENFLYEREGGDYLKLIDFGFSKMLGKGGGTLDVSCGTVSYVAPEVLQKSYSSQCDMWSFGVIVFVLLAGYMPFHGRDDSEIMRAILRGKYQMKSKSWASVSRDARDFVQRLLVKAPEARLTAERALAHPWLAGAGSDERARRGRSGSSGEIVDRSIADSLTCFAKQTRFRRACMQMMAWSLSREERSEVRGAFLELDTHHTGVIKLTELKQVLEEKFQIPEDVSHGVIDAFQGLDTECDGEIHYSEFLAAMMSSRLALHDDLLQEVFRRFDMCNQGYITPTSFRHLLGKSEEVDAIFKRIDRDGDGKINIQELMLYLQSDGAQGTQVGEAAHDLIDEEVKKTPHAPEAAAPDAPRGLHSARAFRALALGSGLRRRGGEAKAAEAESRGAARPAAARVGGS